MSDYSMPPPSVPQMGGEFDRPPGIHFGAISDAWTLITRDWTNWLITSFVGVVIILVLSAPFSIAGTLIQNGGQLVNPDPTHIDFGRMAMGNAMSFLGNFLSYPIVAGLYWAALKQVRGEGISVSSLFEPLRNVGALLVAGLLYSVAIAVGTLFCIIPGIYLAGALVFGSLLIVDQNMGPVEALQASAKRLGSDAWLMFILVLVSAIASAAGVVACCVGIIATLPIYYITVALHYNYYFPKATAGFQLPEYRE